MGTGVRYLALESLYGGLHVLDVWILHVECETPFLCIVSRDTYHVLISAVDAIHQGIHHVNDRVFRHVLRRKLIQSNIFHVCHQVRKDNPASV